MKKPVILNPTCDISQKTILTEQEACVFLGVSRSHILELRQCGKIGFFRERDASKKIKQIRYKREQLLDYINKNFEEVKPLKYNYQ
jgi:hypothetical protein